MTKTPQDETARLTALYKVAGVLGASLDLDQVLTQVMDAVIGLTHAERGFLILVDANTGEWRLRAARNFGRESLNPENVAVSRTMLDAVLSSGQGIVTTDAQSDPRFSEQDSVIFYALRSILCAPLLIKGRTIGAIYVDSRAQAGLFTEADLDFLNAFAAQAAIAIENARLYTQTDRALNHRVQELETLAIVDRELNASLEVAHTIETIRKWTAEVGQAEKVWVLLAGIGEDPTENSLDAIPASHPAASDLVTGPSAGLAFGLSAGLSAYPDDAPANLELVWLAMQERVPLVSTRTASPVHLALPLQHGGRVVGSILVQRGQAFTQAEITFLDHMAVRAAAAFENARLFQAVRQANQAKTKFVSVVTHELRIPMTSIKGYTDLLRQGAVGPVNEMQANFLNVIRNNVERMNALVSDLADISRIETGRLKIECRAISIIEQARELLNSMRLKLEEKSQTLQLHVPQDLPTVYADPNRVVQILTNLVSNAAKYSPEGAGIDLAAVAEADGVRVTIVDRGLGISPADQGKLFGQFFRSEDPQVREQPGWGLGLNVTRLLVELMGGRIGCESTLGEGSTFWFTLPLAH